MGKKKPSESEKINEPKTIRIEEPVVKAIIPVEEPKEKLPQKVQNPPSPKMFNDDGSLNTDGLFDILGSDIRRKILSKLAKFPRYASDLAIDLNVTKQAIKKHLDKLLKFGIVEEVKEKSEDQKIQYYQIPPQAAIFAQVALTPNYFNVAAENTPEKLTYNLQKIGNPEQALTPITPAINRYSQIAQSLKFLGKNLHDIEIKIKDVEDMWQKGLIEKVGILNQIQMIINTLVENDLEKEVIFSFFFDIKSSIEGVSLEDIINHLFLRKKTRAGISKYKYEKPDAKMLQRGRELLDLLRLLIDNLGFIRTEGKKLFFDLK